MEVLYDWVAGLEVGKALVTVCVCTPRARRTETRTFKTTSGSLAGIQTLHRPGRC